MEHHILYYRNHIIEKVSFLIFYIIVFMKYSLNWEVSFIHSKLFTGSSGDIAQQYKLFTSNITI